MEKTHSILIAACACLVALSAFAATTETAKLTASDAAAFDEFGNSVAISGDTVVVGAAGSAYVFVRSGTDWTEQAKLTASAGPALGFGDAVAVSGDSVVVGAAGSAYVFVRSGTDWAEQARLVASDGPVSGFGNSVAVSGDTVVVGAAGSAYVFVRSEAMWAEQAKLTASGGSFLRFGESVAVSGDTAVVGDRWDSHAGGALAGSAYVFVRSGTVWSEHAKLTASDAADFEFFGSSVAVSGDTTVVGAPFDNHTGRVSAGSAYVFVRSGITWSEQAKLTASNPVSGARVGWSVAVSGDTSVLGVSDDPFPLGMVYVFVRSGTDWNEQARLTASDGAFFDGFGRAVAVAGATAVVGARSSIQESIRTGAAYVFQFNEPPVALCRDVISFAGADCTAFASVDDGSFDPDGDTVRIDQDPPGPYGLGDTLVTLSVTDELDASASCEAVVTVLDESPPEVSFTASPYTLWPPDHRMIDIQATVVARDNCGEPLVLLASVSSNESDDALGNGDGRTLHDIQGAETGSEDYEFRLRAERAAAGGGRVYRITYTATDGSGNERSVSADVVVPHDRRRNK